MSFKKKKEKDITLSQVFKNCAFSVKEFFCYNKVYVMISAVCTFLFSAVYAFESTYYVKMLINAVEEHKPFKTIILLISVFFLIYLASQLVDNGLTLAGEVIEDRFERHINRKIFKKASNVELSCYENADFYNKFTRALDGIPGRIKNVCYSCVWCSSEILRIAFYFFVMISVDTGVAFFLIFPIVGNFVFGKWLNSIDQKRYKENTKNQRVIDYVMRVLHLGQYAKEMRITDVYPLMQKKHKEAVNASLGIWNKYALKSGIVYWSKIQFTFLLIFEGILIYCSYRSLVGGSISLSEMTIMTSVMTAAANEIIVFFEVFVTVQNECIYIQNARDFLEYEEKISEDGAGIKAPEKIGTLEFKNVSFRYQGAENDTVKNLSFKIKEGERIALVGHNGAGKSTVVKLLLRLYDPTSGEILLDGINIKDYELKSYRALFSAAFQDYRVLAMSCLENITMGKNIENAEEKAKNALQRVGLWDKVSALEKGLYTTMTREFDDSGAVFSGGQQQKLAVARALVQNGEFMVFDEPSSALDPIAEYDLFKTIMDATKDKTMLLISHRLSSVKAADRIFMLENGNIVESGSHAELMSANGAYADMFVHQAKSYLAQSETGGVGR